MTDSTTRNRPSYPMAYTTVKECLPPNTTTGSTPANCATTSLSKWGIS